MTGQELGHHEKEDEIIFSKEGIENVDLSRRKEYYRRLLKEILQKNSQGLSIGQIIVMTGISRKMIQQHLDFLVATRDAYKWEYGPKSIVYFPNGRLAHPISDIPVELGGKYYLFRMIINDFGKSIQIQEKIRGEGNIFNTVGGIMINENAIEEFIEKLRDTVEGDHE